MSTKQDESVKKEWHKLGDYHQLWVGNDFIGILKFKAEFSKWILETPWKHYLIEGVSKKTDLQDAKYIAEMKIILFAKTLFKVLSQ